MKSRTIKNEINVYLPMLNDLLFRPNFSTVWTSIGHVLIPLLEFLTSDDCVTNSFFTLVKQLSSQKHA